MRVDQLNQKESLAVNNSAEISRISPMAIVARALQKPWWNIKDKSSTSVQLSITDEIGYFGASASEIVAAIKAVPEDKQIDLYIYSSGGSVIEGMEIYNNLLAHKGGVVVTCGAMCASIATLIALAGKTITAPKNSWFMIHNPTCFAGGDSEDLRRMAGIMDKMKDMLVKAYAKKTGKSEKELSALMDLESWYTGEEALSNKFIDFNAGECEESELSSLRNRFDLDHFRNCKISASTPAAGPVRLPGNGADLEKPKTSETNTNTQTIIDKYMKEKSRIFAPVALAMAAPIINLKQFQLPASLRTFGCSNNPPAVLTPEQQEEVKKQAVALFKAKVARDLAIDNLVIKVRNRDKKDFGALATKFKEQDKTVEEFAMEMASSDEFKPFNIAGLDDDGKPKAHDIQVLGVRGLPVGSVGEQFVASADYRAMRDQYKKGSKKRGSQLAETMLNAVGNALDAMGIQNVNTSTGLTSIQKLPGVVELAVRPLMVKDLIAPGATDSTTIRYIRETVFANGAGMVAQGAAKPAATFTFEEVDAAVKKIAVYTKISDELWADFMAVASFINARLPYMVARKEEDQLLTGDGTGNNLTGILATAGIQTQAKGADTAVDAIYKAMTKVRWGDLAGAAQGGYEPDAIVIHPTDWEAIRLTKDANNQYFGGGPFTGAYGVGALVQFESLWGKPVCVTPAITENTALVGSFRLAAQYFQRMGMAIETTNTDQDDFIKNLLTIRAETRLALAVYRPLGFCSVTGI